jgi:hypothetical protein
VLTLLNSYLSHAVVKCWATRGWQRGGGGEMSSLLLLDLRHLRVYPGRCAGSLQDGLLSLQ